MKKNNDNTIAKSLQEYRDFINGKDTEVLVHTVPIKKVSDFSSKDIKAIREDVQVTQRVFAEILAVSPRTVESWEAGRTRPSGPAKRLLGMFKNKPSELLKVISN